MAGDPTNYCFSEIGYSKGLEGWCGFFLPPSRVCLSTTTASSLGVVQVGLERCELTPPFVLPTRAPDHRRPTPLPDGRCSLLVVGGAPHPPDPSDDDAASSPGIGVTAFPAAEGPGAPLPPHWAPAGGRRGFPNA